MTKEANTPTAPDGDDFADMLYTPDQLRAECRSLRRAWAERDARVRELETDVMRLRLIVGRYEYNHGPLSLEDSAKVALYLHAEGR